MEATMKQPSVKFVILTGVTLEGESPYKFGESVSPLSRVTSRQCLVGSFAGAAAS